MNRQSLIDLITPLSPAVSRLTAGHFLLSSDSSTLSASAVGEAFSIQLAMPTTLPAFAIAPDYSVFRSALAGLTGADVSLTPSADSVALVSRGRRTVRCLPAEAYPALPEDDAEAQVIDGDALCDALTFVQRAAYDGLDKPQLGGVHLNGNDVVATDGTRLRIIRLTDSLPKCTVPSASVAALLKVLDGQTKIALGRRLTVIGEGYSFSTSLVAGEFPAKYPHVIPDGTGRDLVVNAEEMMRAVNAVSAFADSKTRRIFLTLDDENVMLSCDAAEEPLNVGSWDGGSHKILFNGLMMADALAAFGKRDVTITLQDSNVAPLLFTDSAGRTGALSPMSF